MQWIIAGLGNPGKEYEGTRHNIGRELVGDLEGVLPKKPKIILPDVYMNNSGVSIKKAIKTKKEAEKLIVVHDELDLPLGKVKISFGSGAGGHNGIKSIINSIKTQDFIRVRVGISGATPSGKLKRPAPEKIADFVLAKFKPADKDKLKKVKKTVAEALELILTEGVERAQTETNAR